MSPQLMQGNVCQAHTLRERVNWGLNQVLLKRDCTLNLRAQEFLAAGLDWSISQAARLALPVPPSARPLCSERYAAL